MMKENWERKLFYLLTPALMGDTCTNPFPATPAQILKANEPLGSGAVESTCRQYQCRFKRTGQFWNTAGDEALMYLETFWRNGQWHQLFPHAKVTSPHLN